MRATGKAKNSRCAIQFSRYQERWCVKKSPAGAANIGQSAGAQYTVGLFD
ncbi:hypothetical protein GCM10023333_30510 [Ferrimonas pelagia]|uniref:Uncharacterized protein n=1 Tax=Ferrimonas pelagia TaxID=1177826 RepID=A0ABP9F8Q1_9GAMM